MKARELFAVDQFFPKVIPVVEKWNTNNLGGISRRNFRATVATTARATLVDWLRCPDLHASAVNHSLVATQTGTGVGPCSGFDLRQMSGVAKRSLLNAGHKRWQLCEVADRTTLLNLRPVFSVALFRGQIKGNKKVSVPLDVG